MKESPQEIGLAKKSWLEGILVRIIQRLSQIFGQHYKERKVEYTLDAHWKPLFISKRWGHF